MGEAGRHAPQQDQATEACQRMRRRNSGHPSWQHEDQQRCKAQVRPQIGQHVKRLAQISAQILGQILGHILGIWPAEAQGLQGPLLARSTRWKGSS